MLDGEVEVGLKIGIGSTRSMLEFSRWWFVGCGWVRSDCEGRPRGCGGHSLSLSVALVVVWSFGEKVEFWGNERGVLDPRSSEDY